MSWRWPWQRVESPRRMVWENFDRRPNVNPAPVESYEDMLRRLAEVPLCTGHSHDEEPEVPAWNAPTALLPFVTRAGGDRGRGVVFRSEP